MPLRLVRGAIFETWAAHDVDELVRLMRKFADALNLVGVALEERSPQAPGKLS